MENKIINFNKKGSLPIILYTHTRVHTSELKKINA